MGKCMNWEVQNERKGRFKKYQRKRMRYREEKEKEI